MSSQQLWIECGCNGPCALCRRGHRATCMTISWFALLEIPSHPLSTQPALPIYINARRTQHITYFVQRSLPSLATTSSTEPVNSRHRDRRFYLFIYFISFRSDSTYTAHASIAGAANPPKPPENTTCSARKEGRKKRCPLSTPLQPFSQFPTAHHTMPRHLQRRPASENPVPPFHAMQCSASCHSVPVPETNHAANHPT